MVVLKRVGLVLLLGLLPAELWAQGSTNSTGKTVQHVICDSGCGSGPSEVDDGSVAGNQAAGRSISETNIWDGAVWRRLTFGQALMAASVPVTLASDQSALHTICDSGCGSPPATADNTVFTGGVTNVSPIAALYDTTPPAITDGNYGAPRMDASRYLFAVFPSAQAVSVTGTNTPDVTDRAGRLLGVTYGSQGQQLQQSAVNFNLFAELRTGGTAYDARSIRALTAADVVTVNNSFLLDATFTGRLPAGSTPATGESNAITTTRIGSYNFIFNGATWDRWTGAVSVSNFPATQNVSITGTNAPDVTDRAGRLLGVTYGSQGQQLQQTAVNFNLKTELFTGGTAYDARSIRALTSADTVTVVQPTGTNLHTVCDSGCAGGTTDTDDGSVAAGQVTSLSLPLNYFYDGTAGAWKRGNLFALAGANAQAVAIVDAAGAQITSFGGGTQYVDGTTHANPTGTVALGKDFADVTRALKVDASGRLDVTAAVSPGATGQLPADGSNSPTIASPPQGVYPLYRNPSGTFDEMRGDATYGLQAYLSKPVQQGTIDPITVRPWLTDQRLYGGWPAPLFTGLPQARVPTFATDPQSQIGSINGFGGAPVKYGQGPSGPGVPRVAVARDDSPTVAGTIASAASIIGPLRLAGLSSVACQIAAGTLAATLVVVTTADDPDDPNAAWVVNFSQTSGTTLSTIVLTNPNAAITVSPLPPGNARAIRIAVLSYTSGAAKISCTATMLASPLAILGIAISTPTAAAPALNLETHEVTREPWTCTFGLAGVAALSTGPTQCRAAPAAGLKLYVTDLEFQSTTATASTVQLKYGTGVDCATGLATLTPIYPTPLAAALPTHISWSLANGLAPAANAICGVGGSAVNTTTLIVSGFTAR